MWFRGKCLKTNSFNSVVEDLIYEIKEVSPKLWKRTSLTVTSVEEFKERAITEKSSRQPVTEYGVVEGEFMYRYKLTAVADSKDELENTNTRVICPKRLSTGDTRIPLRYFTRYEEQVSASASDKKANKKKPSSKQSTGGMDANIIQRRNKAKQIKDKKQKKCASTNSDTTEQLQTVEVVTEQDGPSTPQANMDSTTVPVHDSIVQSAVSTFTDNEDISAAVNVESVKPSVPLDIEGSTSKDSPQKMVLKERIKELEQQLDAAKSNKSKAGKLLEKIAAQTEKITEKIASGTAISCKLQEMKMAVPMDDNTEVPDGHTYVGGEKKFVKTTELARIDERHGCFTQKGEALFELITGESMGGFAKTKRGVKVNPGLNLKIMDSSVITAVTEILRNGFQWLEGERPSHADILEFFRKQPGEVRRRLAKKASQPSKKVPRKKAMSPSSDDEEEPKSKKSKHHKANKTLVQEIDSDSETSSGTSKKSTDNRQEDVLYSDADDDSDSKDGSDKEHQRKVWIKAQREESGNEKEHGGSEMQD